MSNNTQNKIDGLSVRASNALLFHDMFSKTDFARFVNANDTFEHHGVSYNTPLIQRLLKFRNCGEKTINELLVWIGEAPENWASNGVAPFFKKDTPKLYSELLNAFPSSVPIEKRHQKILEYIRAAHIKAGDEKRSAL